MSYRSLDLPPSQCNTSIGILQACGSDHSKWTIAFGWCGSRQSIRRCYRERTNDVRYGVITVQYFSLRLHFTFGYFPDWPVIGFVDPRAILLPGLAITPAPQMDRCSCPMSFLSLTQALKGSVNSMCKVSSG